MQTMLQLVIFLVTQGVVSDKDISVTNSAEYLFYDYIRAGSDADMPYSSSFYLALPPRDEGGSIRPVSRRHFMK